MEHLTIKQRIEIVRIYYQKSLSVEKTIRKLRKKYSKHLCPSESVIHQIVTKFEETGSVLDKSTCMCSENVSSEKSKVNSSLKSNIEIKQEIKIEYEETTNSVELSSSVVKKESSVENIAESNQKAGNDCEIVSDVESVISINDEDTVAEKTNDSKNNDLRMVQNDQLDYEFVNDQEQPSNGYKSGENEILNLNLPDYKNRVPLICKQQSRFHKCLDCEEMFGHKHYLQTHLLNQHSDKKSLCYVCSNVFNSKAQLVSHLLEHSELQFRCYVCESVYKTHRNYVKHMKIHCSIVDYKCELCDKMFATENTYKKHFTQGRCQNVYETEP